MVTVSWNASDKSNDVVIASFSLPSRCILNEPAAHMSKAVSAMVYSYAM